MTNWKETGHPRNVDDEYSSEWGSSQVLEEHTDVVVPAVRDRSFTAILRLLWSILRGK